MIETFTCQLDKSMPRLGWLAIADSARGRLNVIHGEFVECCSDWLVEGVWDGDFKAGEFHKTDTFFGSGIRKVGHKVYFVTSTAQTDRILFCKDQDHLIFSNSLLLLLAYTGASLDEDYDYCDEALSIIQHGLKKYKREFRIIHPRIPHFYQIFYENIVLENGEVTFEQKKRNDVVFKSYEDYYQALMDKILNIRDNFDSHHRARPMTAYTTLSSGYDATAVSCLVRNHGVEECFCGGPLDGLVFKQPFDSGERIARQLTYKINSLDSRRSSISRDELYFLAGNYPKFSNSVWSEISLHSMVKTIQQQNKPALVYMGYFGDEVWGREGRFDPETGDFLTTPAISGLNLAEIRLQTGLVTVSPANFFLNDVAQFRKISNAREMTPWKLNNDYDRPIPRRIVEESGIPREWFGMKKRHITTTYIVPINKKNRRAFYRHLKVNMGIGKCYILAYYLQKRIFVGMLGRKIIFGRNIDFYDLMRKWSTEVLKKEYLVLFKKIT